MGKTEKVNHPSHYNRENAMECIDEMELIFGIEAVKNFCVCNAWKYRYRAADKNGEEDLKKSDWYLNKYKELCKKEDKPTIITIPETTTEPLNPLNPWSPIYYNDKTAPYKKVDITCMGKEE